MKYEKYENLAVSSDALEYEFVSTGPKGNIQKIIKFEPTGLPNLYNLAFGNLKDNGELDDKVVDDNKDRNKILATVAESVYLFFAKYPQKQVFFSGSTPQRTRLYRMAISVNVEELSVDFEIIGILKKSESIIYEPFQKGENYIAFIIRKTLNLAL